MVPWPLEHGAQHAGNRRAAGSASRVFTYGHSSDTSSGTVSIYDIRLNMSDYSPAPMLSVMAKGHPAPETRTYTVSNAVLLHKGMD